MKLKNQMFLIIFLLQIFTIIAFAQQEIEVIPYKIANPTENFPIETGKEYAKLVSITAALNKDIIIIPHEKVNAAFKKLSLNSQLTITEEDLISIGNLGNADNILLGTLSKNKDQYSSDSILYSMKNKKIISKCHISSGNLFNLAEEETNEIFFNSPNKKRTMTDKQIDVVILVDLSYKISAEWVSVKNGIIEFTESVSENWTLNTEINIVPFSEKYNSLNKYSGLKSPQSINEKLKLLIPSGNSSAKDFQNALNYSIKNIPWRKNSEKILIIISNSENIKGKFFEQYALAAKAKKISINSISLGLIKDDALDTLKQIAVIGSGRHYSATYHQKTFNEKGNPVDVFFQDGRIFQSIIYDDSWKDGLFEENRRKQSIMQKPKSFLNEILYDEKKYNINPYNISQYYPALLQLNIVNKEKLENNIASIMQQICANFESAFTKSNNKKTISKVQISDGEISLVIQINNEKDLAALKKKVTFNRFFPLGVVVKKSSNEPYGISFYPDLYATGFEEEYIPDIIKTSINKIIKDPDYFISNGILTPPVWFLDIKVIKLENLKKDYDIRDLGR
jgi:hypothetical protein